MRICKVEGCGRKHEARGFCAPHYQQYQRYGKIKNKIMIKSSHIGCKVEGCGGKHKAKGYCTKHYHHIVRHGEILKRTRLDSNEIIIINDFAETCLYDDECKERARAIIDIEDIEKIKHYKWHLSNNGYVKTNRKASRGMLQHIVMGMNSNRKIFIDHKDMNKLNNRKSNLRLCTRSENSCNREKTVTNTSGYKGVFKDGNRWVVKIKIDGKNTHMGSFGDKIEAAKAYNEAVIKHYGEFARLNRL